MADTPETDEVEYTFIKDFLVENKLYGLVPKSQRAAIDALDGKTSSLIWQFIMGFLGFTSPDNRQAGDVMMAAFSADTAGTSADEKVSAEVYNGLFSQKATVQVASMDYALDQIPLFNREDFNLATITKVAGREAITESLHDPLSSAWTATGMFNTPEVQRAQRALDFAQLHHAKIYTAIVERFDEMAANGEFPTTLRSDVMAYAEAAASQVSGLEARSIPGGEFPEDAYDTLNPSKLAENQMHGSLQYAYNIMKSTGYAEGSWIPFMDPADNFALTTAVTYSLAATKPGMEQTATRLLTGINDHLAAQNELNNQKGSLMTQLGLDPSAQRDQLIWDKLIKGGQIDLGEIQQYGLYMKPEVWANLLNAITEPGGEMKRIDDIDFDIEGNIGQITVDLYNQEDSKNPPPISFGLTPRENAI